MANETGPNKIKAIELLAAMGIKEYEITDIKFGNSLHYGPLLTIIVNNRHIYNPTEFNKIGYGIISRSK